MPVATPVKKGKGETKITRITASDKGSVKKPVKATKTTKIARVKPAIDTSKQQQAAKEERKARRKFKNPLAPFGRYLKGAWYELRQVRWPDRRATWGMTGALILFTLFFVIVIVLLDMGFSYLFKLIMGNS